MDDSGKIAFGLIGAAVVCVVGYVGYHEFERQRDIEEANQLFTSAVSSLNSISAQAAAQSQADREQRYRLAAHQQQEYVRVHELIQGQRCIGGTVIDQKGNSYTQILGPGGRPIPCSGEMASQPVRQ